MIEVLSAPPFLTVQDLGRSGLRSKGVPPSGAMDPDSLMLINLLVGNDEGIAGFEWALGAGQLRFHKPRVIAAAGATLSINELAISPGTAVIAGPADLISLGLPERRFGYLAIGGGLAVPEVLGSRSTYLVAAFGGHEGRRLRRGDRVPLALAAEPSQDGIWSLPEEFWLDRQRPVRLVPGPQSELFDDSAWEHLLGGAYTIAAASDRMGYRLEGPTLTHHGTAALPSEPVCPGAIQVPDGGAPIVLMPDGPTVGGYPKLAVVISADQGHFAQHTTGSRPRFTLVTFEEAVAALRDRQTRLEEAARFFPMAQN